MSELQLKFFWFLIFSFTMIWCGFYTNWFWALLPVVLFFFFLIPFLKSHKMTLCEIEINLISGVQCHSFCFKLKSKETLTLVIYNASIPSPILLLFFCLSCCSLVRRWPVIPARLSSSEWDTSPTRVRWEHVKSTFGWFINFPRCQLWKLQQFFVHKRLINELNQSFNKCK